MNQIQYCLTTILILSTALSCQDFLDRPPLDAINENSYWKTAGDLERYTLKYYPMLPGHENNQGGQANEDANSDNLITASVNPVMNGQRAVTTGNWINEWRVIRSINIFFDNHHTVDAPFESYQHFVGEAHFFKAWFYFGLLKKYGDLPWYSSTLERGSEELTKPRDPRTLVADSILANLDKAIEYLDPRGASGNYRLNKESALAFKTRVALYEGTWQKYHAGTFFGTKGADPEKYFQICVDAAEELIKGDYTKGIFSTGHPDRDYYTLFGLDNMNDIDEVLFYKPYNIGESISNSIQTYTIERTAQMGATWSLISSYLDQNGKPLNYKSLTNEFKGNDFLLEIANKCDPRLQSTIWIPGDLKFADKNEHFLKPHIDLAGQYLCPTGFQVKKFSNPSSSGAGKPQGSSETGYIYFRYAEVLLNYAESLYELNETIAYDALNLLRQRAGMPDFKVISQNNDPNRIDYGYEISDELYEIRRERRIELALEGLRGDDYKRWAAHSLFQGKRPLGYPFKKSEFPDYNPSLDEMGLLDYMQNQLPDGYGFREDRDYLDDIPQDELTLNPNLEQNPGW